MQQSLGIIFACISALWTFYFINKALQICKETSFNPAEIDIIEKNFNLEQESQERNLEVKIVTQTQSVKPEQVKIASFMFPHKINFIKADILTLDCSAIVISKDHLSEDLLQQRLTKEQFKYVEQDVSVIKGQNFNDEEQYIFIINQSFQEGFSKSDEFLFRKRMQRVFQLAKDLDIQELAIPLFYKGLIEAVYKQIAVSLFNEIVAFHSLNTQSTETNIYISEVQKQILQKIIIQINELIQNYVVRDFQIWQYDSEHKTQIFDNYTNYMIDLGLAHFLNDNEYNKVSIYFPFSKSPGTHLVNFSQNTITNLQTKDIEFLEYLKSQPMHLALSYYLENQKKKLQKIEVQVYLNEYVIHFQDKNNLDVFEITNLRTQVRSLVTRKLKDRKPFQKLNFTKIELYFVNYVNPEIKTLQVCGRNESNIDDFIEVLNKKIEEQTEQMEMKIEYNLEDKPKRSLDTIFFINENATQFEFNATSSKLSFTYYIPDREDVLNFFSQATSLTNSDEKNFKRIKLDPTDDDYKNVAKNFNETSPDQIQAIYRINNEQFQEQFVNEVKSLQKEHLEKNQPLDELQINRYLWVAKPYGVLKEDKLAFDITQTKTGPYGKGIHFTQNSFAQRNQAYKIKEDDDELSEYAGSYVIYLCQVATGRVEKVSAPSSSIEGPSDGFDSVLGYIPIGDEIDQYQASDIYVIYGPSARRANILFEVVYKKKVEGID